MAQQQNTAEQTMTVTRALALAGLSLDYVANLPESQGVSRGECIQARLTLNRLACQYEKRDNGKATTGRS